MKKRYFRTAIATAVFLLFLMAFINPGGIFVAIGSLLEGFQIGPLLLKLLYSISLMALIQLVLLIILTLLFGRVYCSFLCPLGILQDIMSRIRKPFTVSYRSISPFIRYSILAVVIGSIILGTRALSVFTDPYANFGRIATAIFRNGYVFVRNSFVYILNFFNNYSIAAEQYSVVTLNSFFAVSTLFILLLVLAYRYRRLYCNILCPVGALLGLVSRFSLFKIRFSESCIHCKKCEQVCKSECIKITENSSFVDDERCIRCFNCGSVCPVDAVSLSHIKPLQIIKKKEREDADPVSRKEFITKGVFISLSIGALSTIPIRSLLKKGKIFPVLNNRSIIPPGAVSVERFIDSCIGCHLCTAACPTKILRPSTTEYGFRGILQPVIDYKNGFCEYTCISCSQVCPTDAIRPITVKDKQKVRIGNARLAPDECIVYKDSIACGACAEHCPTGALKMDKKEGLSYPAPAIDDQLCIGCGACEYVCPAAPKAFKIEPLSVHERRKTRDDKGVEIEVDETEFPF
ncbi:MAG: 4Fe-4S binding protein [Spirochaetes bacterium]|jgi:ferredoxin|nr:4Fe-4S binding protein [Spirochaetota bacterium]